MPGIPARSIAIMGATATGKSALGVRLALRFGGEVVSMDSCQVYRGMDVGTGKLPLRERGGVPHHLLDILDPDETGSAGRHAALARSAIAEIAGRGAVPILVGGTGLYFEALFHPLIDVEAPPDEIDRIRRGFEGRPTGELYDELRRVDPERADDLSPNDRLRITRALEIHRVSGVPMSEHLTRQRRGETAGEFLAVVLTMPRGELRARIARRTGELYEAGWIDEVRGLLRRGFAPGCPGMKSLGYEEIAAALAAGDDPRATLERVVTRTQQYAKRQETYFRRFADAVWLDVTAPGFAGRAEALAEEFLGLSE